jgi:uncharacterized protein (TIGR02145 family)
LSIAGGKMKEAGYNHWISPNTGATNESGFTALPGGIRHSDGILDHLGYVTQFWSATESGTTKTWDFELQNTFADIFRADDYKWMGQSVRCVRD